jgi:hypothetical protein
LGRREEAFEALLELDPEQLTYGERADYAFTLASVAIETKDRNHLAHAKDMLTALQIAEPLFREQRDSFLKDVQKALNA